MQTDEDIVRQIVNGETEMFRVLVERHKDVSLTLAYTILKDTALAEDVLQEAFLKAFKNLKRFNFEASFSTWFHRIVLNTSYNTLKKTKNRRTEPLENRAIKETGNSTGFDILRGEERTNAINHILDTMKPNESLVLRLHYLADRKVGEIAKITALSPSNVKVILHRARINFRSALDDLLGPEKTNLL